MPAPRPPPARWRPPGAGRRCCTPTSTSRRRPTSTGPVRPSWTVHRGARPPRRRGPQRLPPAPRRLGRARHPCLGRDAPSRSAPDDRPAAPSPGSPGVRWGGRRRGVDRGAAGDPRPHPVRRRQGGPAPPHRAAAHEVGARGVRVVGGRPGSRRPARAARGLAGGCGALGGRERPGRPVTPEEVADTVAFLASPGASGITGTTVTIDAGLVRRRPLGDSRHQPRPVSRQSRAADE